MARLIEKIRKAVEDDRFVVSVHATLRCEERGASAWQLAAGISEAAVVEERPASRPNPSVVLRHQLADGRPMTAIWAWLEPTSRAKLVTVFEGD